MRTQWRIFKKSIDINPKIINKKVAEFLVKQSEKHINNLTKWSRIHKPDMKSVTIILGSPRDTVTRCVPLPYRTGMRDLTVHYIKRI